MVQGIESKAETAIQQARREVNEENNKKAVKALKELLKQEIAAKTALDNIQREIKDMEIQIEQGNL